MYYSTEHNACFFESVSQNSIPISVNELNTSKNTQNFFFLTLLLISSFRGLTPLRIYRSMSCFRYLSGEIESLDQTLDSNTRSDFLNLWSAKCRTSVRDSKIRCTHTHTHSLRIEIKILNPGFRVEERNATITPRGQTKLFHYIENRQTQRMSAYLGRAFLSTLNNLHFN